MKKIITVVGARPQFIKAAVFSRARRKHAGDIEEIVVHTGQHFDQNMSGIFFSELGIDSPKYNLEINGGMHGEMTARMMIELERVMGMENPDLCLIYGDTNSTLAAALVAAKLHIPIAHVEAGLRSFNFEMPEEINRVISDRLAKYLFCPTEESVNNAKSEGLLQGCYLVGDVMYDSALYYSNRVDNDAQIMDDLNLEKKCFVLVTCHRQENTDSKENLKNIVHAIHQVSASHRVVFPIHPRTKKQIEKFNLKEKLETVLTISPQSYSNMIALEKNAKLVLTDSGGVQKEAYFNKTPCITMRDETEWVETVNSGWNVLTGADSDKIIESVENSSIPDSYDLFYGDGTAGEKIVEILQKNI